jgi:hypothetical protein
MSVIASIVAPNVELGGCPPEPSEFPSEPEPKLVVAKAVRAFVNSLPTPVKCSAGLISAVDSKLRDVLLEAVARAQANGRKTLKPADL